MLYVPIKNFKGALRQKTVVPVGQIQKVLFATSEQVSERTLKYTISTNSVDRATHGGTGRLGLVRLPEQSRSALVA